jgi:hypothetical protein
MVGSMTGPGRALILTAVLVAFVYALPAAARADSPFRQVVAYTDGRIESDGVRFASIEKHTGPPPVFDTLRGRRFRPAAPMPECRYDDSGGGLALWSCPPPRRRMITNLATGRSREPPGIAQVDAIDDEPNFFCGQGRIGRHWLVFTCGPGIGSSGEVYLNHRTGMIADLSGVYDGRRDPVFDLNYEGLLRYACRPLEPGALTPLSPPFALEVEPSANLYSGDIGGLRLRRCGRERRETLSNCRFLPCVSPQLGSRYVTWAEDELVLAYLPRIRRRVLVGRPPSELRGYGPPLAVAHTCNRVFAQWGSSIYVARFEPRRGAPPCQAGRESALAR